MAMRASDQLAALRRDDAPQRRIQQQLQDMLSAWRRKFRLATLEQELTAFAGGTDLTNLPALARLFTPREGAALALVMGLTTELTSALSACPLGLVPLRHSTDAGASTLLLAQQCGATLTIQLLHGAAAQVPPAVPSVSFAPLETWEHMLTGAMEAERIVLAGLRGERALLRRDMLQLKAGDVMQRDSMCEAVLPRCIHGSLVSLRLQRRGARSVPVRAYRLDGGSLCRSAASDPRDSRLELAAAVLGRMGRADAAPLLADLACEDFGEGLRWQALRECLALDVASGFGLLAELAERPADALSGPARALRGQLLADHPQLAALLKDQATCPA